jgi:ribonuclease P protein component
MAHTEHLTIYWMQDKRGHRRRFGFVTSKKVGKAHDRNLVRRRLRHVCAACVESFIPGDYIFVARPGSPEISQDALAVELFSAREKLYSRLPKEQPTAAPIEVASAKTIDGVDATSGVSESPIIAVATTQAGTDSDDQPVSLPVRMIRVYQMISQIGRANV